MSVLTSLFANGATLDQKNYYHIGLAVDTLYGLLVRVVWICIGTSVVKIFRKIVALCSKAKKPNMAMTEMSGDCFALSSLGNLFGTHSLSILQAWLSDWVCRSECPYWIPY